MHTETIMQSWQYGLPVLNGNDAIQRALGDCIVHLEERCHTVMHQCADLINDCGTPDVHDWGELIDKHDTRICKLLCQIEHVGKHDYGIRQWLADLANLQERLCHAIDDAGLLKDERLVTGIPLLEYREMLRDLRHV